MDPSSLFAHVLFQRNLRLRLLPAPHFPPLTSPVPPFHPSSHVLCHLPPEVICSSWLSFLLLKAPTVAHNVVLQFVVVS